LNQTEKYNREKILRTPMNFEFYEWNGQARVNRRFLANQIPIMGHGLDWWDGIWDAFE
jgi:hypothetical protein